MLKARRFRREAGGVRKTQSHVVIVLTIGALALTGCAATDERVPSHVPAAPTAVAALGQSAFDIGCTEIVAPGDLDAAFGQHVELATEDRFGLEPFQMYITALEQDGALRCDWGQLHEAPSMTFFGLPDAAVGFNVAATDLNSDHRYRELKIFDDSYYSCYYDYPDLPQLNCDWQILAGDVWVTVALKGLQYAEYEQPDSDPTTSQFLELSKDSGIVRFLSDTVNSLVAAPRLQVKRSVATLGSCSELIDASSVAAVVPGDVQIFDVIAPGEITFGIATSSEGDPMWELSMQRLGYRYCVVAPPPSGGYTGTQVIVAPGGAWAFDSSKQQHLDGLGNSISECTSTQDGPFCRIAVLVGETLVTVESNEASPVVGSAVIKGVVANLG